MSNEEIIKHWLVSADEDKKSAEALFESRHYHWSLFLWHLTIEKTLKAILTKQDKEIPFTHNLLQLVILAQIGLTDKLENELKEITSFNLEARYDDYKLSFYKKATQTYTQEWVSKCKDWQNRLKSYL
jgi:HEPN domain-containing protein